MQFLKSLSIEKTSVGPGASSVLLQNAGGNAHFSAGMNFVVHLVAVVLLDLRMVLRRHLPVGAAAFIQPPPPPFGVGGSTDLGSMIPAPIKGHAASHRPDKYVWSECCAVKAICHLHNL